MLHDLTLLATALMLGAAGTPHCLSMCSVACHAACHDTAGQPVAAQAGSFHLARVLGYATVGAIAASGVAVLAELATWSAAFRPLWTLAHIAALLLGLWLLYRGALPAGLARFGRGLQYAVVAGPQAMRASKGIRSRSVLRVSLLGLAWAALPCGLLQSAVLVASLANSPQGGAMVMAGFALVTGAGMWGLAPLLRRALSLGAPGQARWPTRAAGALLAGAASWTLFQAAVHNGWC